MVDRPTRIIKSKSELYSRYEFGEVTVTLADTITFASFDASSTIWQVFIFQKSNGQEVTCTTALNVATITGAVANAPCLYIAYGIKV